MGAGIFLAATALGTENEETMTKIFQKGIHGDVEGDAVVPFRARMHGHGVDEMSEKTGAITIGPTPRHQVVRIDAIRLEGRLIDIEKVHGETMGTISREDGSGGFDSHFGIQVSGHDLKAGVLVQTDSLLRRHTFTKGNPIVAAGFEGPCQKRRGSREKPAPPAQRKRNFGMDFDEVFRLVLVQGKTALESESDPVRIHETVKIPDGQLPGQITGQNDLVVTYREDVTAVKTQANMDRQLCFVGRMRYGDFQTIAGLAVEDLDRTFTVPTVLNRQAPAQGIRLHRAVERQGQTRHRRRAAFDKRDIGACQRRRLHHQGFGIQEIAVSIPKVSSRFHLEEDSGTNRREGENDGIAGTVPDDVSLDVGGEIHRQLARQILFGIHRRAEVKGKMFGDRCLRRGIGNAVQGRLDGDGLRLLSLGVNHPADKNQVHQNRQDRHHLPSPYMRHPSTS